MYSRVDTHMRAAYVSVCACIITDRHMPLLRIKCGVLFRSIAYGKTQALLFQRPLMGGGGSRGGPNEKKSIIKIEFNKHTSISGLHT